MHKLDLTEKHDLRVIGLGLIATLLLAIAKGFVGTIAHSSALIVAAGRSVYDMLSGLVTL